MKIEALLSNTGRSKVIRGRDAEISFERANELLPGTLDGLVVAAANRGFSARCYECDFERCGVRRLAGFLADGVSPFSLKGGLISGKAQASYSSDNHQSLHNENSHGSTNANANTDTNAGTDIDANANAGNSDDDNGSVIWHMVALNLALNRIASAATASQDQDPHQRQAMQARSDSNPKLHQRQRLRGRASHLLRPLRHLCVLDLSNNLLECMSDLGLDYLPHLQVLNLANNHIEALCFGWRNTSRGTGTTVFKRGSAHRTEGSITACRDGGKGEDEDEGEKSEGKAGDGNENERSDRTPMPMRCLRRLDVSMNAILQLDEGEMARLPVLETLNVAGNQLTHLGGLSGLARCQIDGGSSNPDLPVSAATAPVKPLGSLRCLDVQCNLLDDVSGLQSVANLGLLRLHLSSNRLHDLDQLSHVICLLTRPGLRELFASRNPVCASRDYRLRLLEAPALQVLDHTAVTPFLRRRCTELRGDRAVEACVASTTSAYMAAIAAEQRHADELIAYHRSQIQQVQSAFVEYKKQLEAELEDCVGYTQSLANPSMRSSYLLTPDAAEEWRKLLDKDMKARSQRADDAALELADAHARDIASRSAGTAGGYFTKLRALAFHRPGVWQAMKASELRRRERDEAKREEREEREAQREACRVAKTMHVAGERAESAVAALRPHQRPDVHAVKDDVDIDYDIDSDGQQSGQQLQRQVQDQDQEQQQQNQEQVARAGKADDENMVQGRNNTDIVHTRSSEVQREATAVRASETPPKQSERASAATTLQAWWRCKLGQRLYARMRSVHMIHLDVREGVDSGKQHTETKTEKVRLETGSSKAKQELEHLESEAKDKRSEKTTDKNAVHHNENPNLDADNTPGTEPQQPQQQKASPPLPTPAVQQTRQKSSACTIQ